MTSSSVSALFPFAPRILPELDDTSRPYWTAGAAGELRIAHCGGCGRFVHPPEDGCPQCGGPLTFEPVSGDGLVFTHTTAHQQFHPAVPTPFVIALVELPEQPGLRIVTNIVGCEPDAVFSGMPVRVRFERIDRDDAEPVFVPVFTPALT
ncbi:Zn-ribbon domain-containing OB-fold protein [Mycolicibacterium thermoresistibile]